MNLLIFTALILLVFGLILQSNPKIRTNQCCFVGGCIFAGGVLFGTAGIKVLSSKDAKKVYTSCTAAFLRAKECVMNTVSTVQENAGDIYAGAKEINEERAAKAEAEAFADAEAEAAEKTETAENTEE